MTRTYTDYSTFSAGESMWFVGDQDARIRLGGVVLNGDFRGDLLSLGGSRGLGRPGHRGGVSRTLRMIGLPRIFLPPRI